MRFVSVRAKVRQNFAPDLIRGVDLRGVVSELVPTAGAMHPGELKLMQLEKTNAVKAAELAAGDAGKDQGVGGARDPPGSGCTNWTAIRMNHSA